MDPFALVLLGSGGAFAIAMWLIGRYFPGSGSEQLGLRSGREITESRAALDAEDLDQLLAVHNARRRARGQSPMSAEELMAERHEVPPPR